VKELLHSQFRQTVFDHFAKRGRQFPWRETRDPYAIWVSEIMLQQTQTERVVPKYVAFLAAFPTVQDLAHAEPTEVLKLWQGLGYNRRGLALHKAAQQVVQDHDGIMPNTEEALQSLPGIGAYTAAAICAFAYNQPAVMIETNIRRVFIHHFFHDSHEVHDRDIMTYIAQTVDKEHPREWYYALMDYGAALPKQIANPNRKSKHYVKQSTFEGSNRQVRGAIMKLSLENPDVTLKDLENMTGFTSERLEGALKSLQKDDFPLPKNLIIKS
jgi:A/G-specific adenine glycosylase